MTWESSEGAGSGGCTRHGCKVPSTNGPMSLGTRLTDTVAWGSIVRAWTPCPRLRAGDRRPGGPWQYSFIPHHSFVVSHHVRPTDKVALSTATIHFPGGKSTERTFEISKISTRKYAAELIRERLRHSTGEALVGLAELGGSMGAKAPADRWAKIDDGLSGDNE